MNRILLSGCNGKMGRVITSCAAERKDCQVVAGVDVNPATLADFPVFSSPVDYNGSADVIIDFSHPSALTPLLSYAVKKKIPAVIATTGLTDDQVEEIKKAAHTIPVFCSGNMSLGINLLLELVKKATAVLGGGFDVEIVEKHHNQKIDAPSGTALMLADAVAASSASKSRYTYDRHSQRKKRDSSEIGIHSIRGGTIVGEHEVIFAGRDEIVTLSHTALSKEILATGSLNAAVFLAKQAPGLYNMADLVAAN